MNGPLGDEQERSRRQGSTDHNFSQAIASALQTKASQIQLTPALRQQILQRALRHEQHLQRRRLIPLSLALIAVLLFVYIATSTLFQPAKLQTVAGPRYRVEQTSNVAPVLASGGLLLSVDPTDQRIIYQPAHQTGVFYTASIADPVRTSVRAMDNAQDMSWSKDGSALVATVLPQGSNTPALALVQVGHYMHLLGENALAASWSPGSSQEIIYAAQHDGQTELWRTDSTGKAPQLQMRFPASLLVQHMYWSPDGRYLALVTGIAKNNSSTTQTQTSRAIYIMDSQTGTVKELVVPGVGSIGNVAWSPDSTYLSYEELQSGPHIQLENIDVQQPSRHFTVLSQHSLQGWSWAPDSQSLVYSDNGTLYIHTLKGQTTDISDQANRLISPFWLKDGRILCMQIQNTQGELAILRAQNV